GGAEPAQRRREPAVPRGWVTACLVVCAAATVAGAQAPAPPSHLDAIARLAGRTHPILVHFPIALLITGALVELWRAIRRHPGVSPTGFTCVVLGGLAAAAAAGAGWLSADFDRTGPDSTTLTIHRWIGVSVACASMVVIVLGLVAARSQSGRGTRPYRVLLILVAIAVGVGGHFGGMMTYGDDYFSSAIS